MIKTTVLKKFLFFSFSLFVIALLGCNGKTEEKYIPDYSEIEETNYLPSKYVIRDEGKDDTIFYSDDYFKHRSTNYDSHLATLSIYSAKYSMNPGNPNSEDDTYWYQHQSDRLANFWTTIGFTDSYFNHDYYERTSFDSVGIGCAQRRIKEANYESTVIACTVRSGGYFYEWENNVFLGDGSKSDYMHEGWYNAANRVIDFIKEYLSELKNKKALKTDHIKIWLSGFSRGGAIMNITGGLLDNMLGPNAIKSDFFDGVYFKRDDVYVYTFEAPQGANLNSETVEAPRNELYYNIFNVVNPNDLVTKVAMSRYGFTRFGIDKFIVTKFFDPYAFDYDRSCTIALAHDYDANFEWKADNFTTYGIDYSTLLKNLSIIGDVISWATGDADFPKIIYQDTNKQNYDPNIVIDMLLDRAIDNLGDRNSYCRNFQTLAVNLMHYMMGDVVKKDELTWEKLAIMLAIQSLGYVVLGSEAGLITDLSLAQITGCTSAQVGLALSIAGDVFLEYPTEVISVCKYIHEIFDNHSTQLNVIHAQAQDSYFIDNYNNNHETDPIRRVPYRTNSEYVRFECKDINEVSIYVDGERRVYVNEPDDVQAEIQNTVQSHENQMGNARIYQLFDGFAVGVYSYATYHRLEVFVPSFYDFKYHFYEHSWKAWHLVKIVRWTYNTNENNNRTGVTIVDEYFNCDADVFEGNYEHDSDYETDLLADLTNTEWNFNIKSISSKSKINQSVEFVSNGETFNNIKAVVSPPAYDHLEIYYGDTKVAEGNASDMNITWINDKYKKIKFTGGTDITSVFLIMWIFNNAYQTNL